MAVIKIKGMSCQHCVLAVTKALHEIDGVRNVSVDLASGSVSYDEEKPVAAETVRERVKRAGYEVV